MFEGGSAVVADAVVVGPDAVAWLAGLDPRTAGSAVRVEALVLLQRLAAWTASVEVGLLASFQDDADAAASTDPGDREWVSEEVGAVLRLRGDYAAERMRTAATLVRRLPDTVALLSAGAIMAVQARMLAEQVADRDLDDNQCARVEARVLGRAAGQSSTQFRQSLTRALLAVAPRTFEQAHEVEAQTRRVFTRPGEDGMGWLLAYLPVAELMTVKTAIWRLAQANKNQADADATAARAAAEAAEAAGAAGAAGEGAVAAEGAEAFGDESGDGAGFVSIDAYRADALIELAARYLTDTDPRGVLNRQAPAIRVVVSLATLTGDSDEPADLTGYGPIPASLARLIAADPDGTWQRLVTDPLGRLIDLGRTRYRPPKLLADHIHARDQTCAFPTCNRAAENCELDHVCDWAHGGRTCAENLVPLRLSHESVAPALVLGGSAK